MRGRVCAWLARAQVCRQSRVKLAQVAALARAADRGALCGAGARLALDAAAGAALLRLLDLPAVAPLRALDALDEALRGGTRWLARGQPWGVKLNAPLAAKLGEGVTAVVDAWAALRHAAPLSDAAVLAPLRLCATVGGASLALACGGDALALATLHLRLLSGQLVPLARALLAALASLWRLFRGLKHNALRGRVDSAGFDEAQLLLGTLLFSALLFLAPTLLMFAGLAALCWGCAATVGGALQAAVAALNGASATAVGALAAAWLARVRTPVIT